MNFIYRIKAVNSGVESAYSNTAVVFIPDPAPVNELGYHTVFSQVVYNENRRAQKVTMPEDGTLQDISMYHDPASGNVIYGVYSDNSGYPGTLLGATASVAAGGVAGWQTVGLQTPVPVGSGTGIWLAWVYEYGTEVYYGPGSPGRAHAEAYYTSPLPAQFGTSTQGNYIYSIYATLLPDAGTKGAEESADVPETDLPTFTIFPNPSYGKNFYIRPNLEMEGSEQVRIEVLDLSGTLFFREIRSAEDLALPLRPEPDHLPDKLVIVRITTDEHISIFRLVLRE